MTDSRTIRWGIIGPGLIARKLADAVRIDPDSRLVAAASKSLERARAFCDEHDGVRPMSYEELAQSEDVDVVYVATTHNFHYENARLALEHGKHVLMEKPFTVNAREARELVDLARANNCFLMEAIWVRFLPSYRRLKAELQAGAIGTPKLVDVTFGGFVGPDHVERLTNPALAGGTTLDMGIYPITFACYMLGETPSEILSMTDFSATGIDETASYQFRFPSGAFASINTSHQLMMKNEAVIYGSKGYIEYPDMQSGERFTIAKHGGTNEIRERVEVHESNHTNGFVYQVAEVVRCLREGRRESDVIPLSETVAIMEVMDQMRAAWGLSYPFEKD